jgi:hypothetical protein
MNKPEHVEQLESGGTMCRFCGGRVDGEGYAMGGDVDEEPLERSLDEEMAMESEDMPEQQVATERMRAAAFADAVKRRRSE